MAADCITDEHLLSVVVPVLNEEAVLESFYQRLQRTLTALGMRWEVVFVDDGSTDGSRDVLRSLAQTVDTVALLGLSRNFGKEIAISAGLEAARGDAVIIIDADLQDPPELIPQLVERWREGYANVYAQRAGREGESFPKRWTASAFYRLLASVTNIEVPIDAGDYRLLDRRAVDALLQFREHHRFMKGLYAWVGYRAIAVPYERAPRAAGTSKWSYWKLWNHAIEGLTSFTVTPLKLATYLGLGTALLALVYAGIVVVKTLLFGDPVQGYPSLMVAVLFLGGTQLLFLGIAGEYIGRIFNEVKGRPLYLIDERRESKHDMDRLTRSSRAGDSDDSGNADAEHEPDQRTE